MSLILIVEDVEAMRRQYAYDLARLGGHQIRETSSVDEALDVIERDPIDCVILDLEMPRRDGFDFLREVAARGVSVPVIVYTGTGDYDRCVRAVKLGAAGFIDKAEPMERVLREISHALERAKLRREVSVLRGKLGDDSALIGESRAMKALRERIARLAPIPSPVLILGESGTGKELVARDLHALSPRSAEPFLAVNCAALPENLVESELFGHEKGAFTGAERARRGAFESAGGGTLFLDEVGELPGAVQAKLLRVLEGDVVTPVGGNREVPVACRVVAATNRDLDTAVRDGTFREDLLYRLNVHIVSVPPLRDRLSDVAALVEHFLQATARRFGTRAKRIAPEAVALLKRYDWRRNNVRELRNIVERLVIATDGERIHPEDVPEEIHVGDAENSGDGTLKSRKAEAERRILIEALERNEWHLTRTAKELGLADHASLSKILKRHGLKKN